MVQDPGPTSCTVVTPDWRQLVRTNGVEVFADQAMRVFVVQRVFDAVPDWIVDQVFWMMFNNEVQGVLNDLKREELYYAPKGWAGKWN